MTMLSPIQNEIAMNESLYQIPLKSINGQALMLADFKGLVLLVVNVASKCGLTPQYEGLESLFKRYRKRGLQVLGFPCNDFASQEPGSADDIQRFCTTNFAVDFPMFEKVNINSEPRHPLYASLIAACRKRCFRQAAIFARSWPAMAVRRKIQATCYGISKNS
jgi:glutathione peroxidase